MKVYEKRVVDEELQERLESGGAVLIEGPKWCGKTTTAEQAAGSVLRMDVPSMREQNMSMADSAPENLLKGDTPRLLDEWQLAPKLWDAVRFEVDQRGEPGQFILTGSAVPPDTEQISHSGVGRISRMRMRPMSLYELKKSNGKVSLSALFSGEDVFAESDSNLDDMAQLICTGGWPMIMNIKERAALRIARDYFEEVVESDLSRVDNVERDPDRAAKLLRSYARHVGSSAPFSTLLDDIKDGGGLTVSEGTLYSYISAFRKIFLVEDAPAWNVNLRSKTAVRTSDTHYFTDPSLACAALGIGPGDLLGDLNTMGFLFENLCMRDLRIYAQALDGQVYHYRDKSGLECDAVIHLRNGNYGLVEIKLGGDRAIEEGVRSLNKLLERLDTRKMREPSFRMILTGISPYAYRRKDGIYIVPVGCLKN